MEFNFLAKRKLALYLSITILLASIISILYKGLNLGQDFTGGILVEIDYKKPINIEKIKTALSKQGFNKTQVQYFGSIRTILVRTNVDKQSKQYSDKLVNTLLNYSSAELKRMEFVGPQVGEELSQDGVLALLVAFIGVLLYVAFRFEYRFAIGAITALIHDVLITIGIFSLLNWEFNLNVLAAVLAVIGYSLNDTIVVFDRIRENFILIGKNKKNVINTPDIINLSLNQTLSRTLVTSLTTILVLLALLLGGESIKGFAYALLIGVIVGTYSSIYVAANCLLIFNVSYKDLLPPEKEGKEIYEKYNHN